MKLSRRLGLVACGILSLVSGLSLAQGERAYDASIALGHVGTSGNTNAQTFNAEGLFTYRTDSWIHNMKLQVLHSSTNGTTDAERYYLEDKLDYFLKGDSYLFGKGTYMDDKFSGYDYQASLSTGYGHYLIQQATLSIQAYGGLGYRENEVANGSNTGEGIISIGETLEWLLGDTSKIVQNFDAEIGEEATVTKFSIGLESNIIGNIVTKIAFEARNISKVPVGIKKTDTLTSISLVYTF